MKSTLWTLGMEDYNVDNIVVLTTMLSENWGKMGDG